MCIRESKYNVGFTGFSNKVSSVKWMVGALALMHIPVYENTCKKFVYIYNAQSSAQYHS